MTPELVPLLAGYDEGGRRQTEHLADFRIEPSAKTCAPATPPA
jgi:hypothetical protein